jgi:hypothetical protein
MNNLESPGLLDDTEVVASYSREQAITDGVLVDVSSIAQVAGFKVPVALTAAVRARLEPFERDASNGQSFEGRLRDILMLLRCGARNVESDTVIFEAAVSENDEQHMLNLKAYIGPGDHAEPVVIIMFEHQVCFAHLPTSGPLELRSRGWDEAL